MRKLARAVVAVVLLTGAAGAQPKPDFAGRWEIVSPPAGSGQIQVVTQDAKALSTYFLSQGPQHRRTYQLDGVERRLAIPAKPSITTLARAAWEGNRLVITERDSYPNGAKIQSKDVWSIDPKGRLVIDHTESDQNGRGESRTVVLVKKS